MEKRYARLYEEITQALTEKPKREALYKAMKRGRDGRARAFSTLAGGETLRDRVRAVKLRCLKWQDELLERFTAAVEKRGTKVFFAKDGQAAIDYTLSIAQRCRARTLTKSKSLTSEEIEVNAPLEAAGVEVIETDLGELIIQKVAEKPYHLVFPAVHKTAAEVADIFRNTIGGTVPEDIEGIVQVVRKYLRPIFLNAEIGMTGANVGVADSGTIVIETNEGNARLVSSIPDIHICIMGVEKIVETYEDAFLMMLAHPVSAVGQLLTTYVTIMGGRSPLGDNTGREPRESHIIILDNGRSAMRKDPIMSDALNCIRCGACMNICPTYGVVGGHSFGYIYPGPIGIPWTAAVHGLEKAGDFAHLCVSCGLCKEICPAQIDIPMMIAEVKHRDMAEHPQPRVNRVMMSSESFSRFGSATAPLSNLLLKTPPFRWIMEKLTGVDRRRVLPTFERKTFTKRFAVREAPSITALKRRVAYFVDLYANYNAPHLGMAAVEKLEAAGCEVIVPPQQSSGYPYIGYGDLGKARKTAHFNVGALAPYAKDGYDIVATEPTAAYTLKVAYPKLLGTQDAELVAKHTHEFFEYLLLVGDGLSSSSDLAGKRFGFHCSCHQQPLGAGQATMEWLRRNGANVELVETGTCCGMAGTFGLKTGPLGYGLSQGVGEPLFEAFAKANVEAIVTESSVCAIQLREGTGLPVYHPLELL